MALKLLSKSRHTKGLDNYYYICIYSSDLMTSFDVYINDISVVYKNLHDIYNLLKSRKEFGGSVNFYIHNYDITKIEDIDSSNCDQTCNNFPVSVYTNILNNIMKNTDNIDLDDDGDLSDNSVIYNIVKDRLNDHIYNSLK